MKEAYLFAVAALSLVLTISAFMGDSMGQNEPMVILPGVGIYHKIDGKWENLGETNLPGPKWKVSEDFGTLYMEKTGGFRN